MYRELMNNLFPGPDENVIFIFIILALVWARAVFAEGIARSRRQPPMPPMRYHSNDHYPPRW